jgi:ornithine cyclodeaminase
MIARCLLRGDHIHAEIGQIVCGERAGRADPQERILFWHRGFAISDIVLGSWIAEQAREQGMGQMLTLWDGPDE